MKKNILYAGLFLYGVFGLGLFSFCDDLPDLSEAAGSIQTDVKLINKGLTHFPFYLNDIARVHKDLVRIREEIKLHKDGAEKVAFNDAEFLKKYRDELTISLDNFIDFLHDYRFLLRNLFDFGQRKKGEDGVFKKIPTKLEKFFDIKTKDKARNFLVDHVDSIDYLDEICAEFNRFSVFLVNKCIDKKTKLAYRSWLEEQKNTKE